jgi:hypothetical protein
MLGVFVTAPCETGLTLCALSALTESLSYWDSLARARRMTILSVAKILEQLACHFQASDLHTAYLQ